MLRLASHAHFGFAASPALWPQAARVLRLRRNDNQRTDLYGLRFWQENDLRKPEISYRKRPQAN